MKSNSVTPGLFGKVPVLGDFVSRRLPGPFVRTWDTWLQGALSASKEQLGSQWLDVYLTSPIWRFVLSPGICEKTAWTGVLMPSVDKVGRYFPLTLAVLIDMPETLPGLFVAAAEWFDELEQLALSALETDFNLDEFDQNLQKLALPSVPRTNERCHVANGFKEKTGNIAFHVEMKKLEQISAAFVDMTASLLNGLLPVYSMWSTHGSERISPCLRVYEGLPPSAAFCDFLISRRQADGGSSLPTEPLDLPGPDSSEVAGARESDCVEMVARMQWRSSARSTVGKKRKINEDAFLERPEIGLWAVADGMGGHLSGDVASRAVVHALSGIPASDSLETLLTDVSACLRRVNAELVAMADTKGQGQIMGSTVVVMLAVGNRCASIWAGDSRLYRYRDAILSQLTDDHSLAVELSRQGVFTVDEINAKAPDNIVTRAMGAESELAIDTIAYEAQRGDTYLLCSDGLVKEVNPPEIADILKQGGCQEASQRLIDVALARGARDNVTVIVVHAGQA